MNLGRLYHLSGEAFSRTAIRTPPCHLLVAVGTVTRLAIGQAPAASVESALVVIDLLARVQHEAS